MSYTRRSNSILIPSSPIVKIGRTPDNSLIIKRRSPLYNLHPIFPNSPTVHPPLISSAEMNRKYQQKVEKEAHKLMNNKKNKIKDSIYRNRRYQLYLTPEHPYYHDVEVDYRDVIAFKERQEKFQDELNAVKKSPDDAIWYGGRKKRTQKRTQKRKLRKTKRKKQNKRKSRKSRK